MTAVDWVIVAVIALSVLLGLLRGLLYELLSLAGWIVGVLLALRYASTVGAELPFDLWPAAKTALAALGIVIGCVIVAGITAWIVRKLLAAAKLSGADRLLGGLFGLLRGALIVGAAVFFTMGTALSAQPMWRESSLLPQVEAAVRWMMPMLPPALKAATAA